MSLKHTHGRVVVKVDMNYKDSHRFEDGTEIKLVRRVNNFDRKHTEPVNAIVMSSENIPEGAEILIHHNSLTDENRIFNYKPLSGSDIASDIKYFSIPELQAYIWKMPDGDWQPIKGFATGLRVFEPYKGFIQGIPPKKLNNILYITSGEYKGQCVMTLKASDYEVIFQDNGRERRIIRLRHFENEPEHEREEIILVHHNFTKKVNKGELLIGLTPSDAKPLQHDYKGIKEAN
jgi:hypothetical protein